MSLPRSIHQAQRRKTIQEVAAHELAHTLDNNAEAPAQSGLQDYNNAVIWDFYKLDRIDAAHSRPACTTGSDGKAGPFVGTTSKKSNISRRDMHWWNPQCSVLHWYGGVE